MKHAWQSKLAGISFAGVIALPLISIGLGQTKPLPKPTDSDAAYATFPPEHGTYWVTPLRIIDGDSLIVGVVVPIKCRISEINAPEMNTPDGQKAKEQLEALTVIGKVIPAHFSGREKWGRYLVDYRGPQEQMVSKVMVEGNFAKWYNEKGPRP